MTFRDTLIQCNTQAEIESAIRGEYAARQSRRTDPDGSFDRQGRFDLSDQEYCSCCIPVRSPSRRWPYSQMTHARTLKHIRHLAVKLLAEVDAERVTRLVASAPTTTAAVAAVANR